MTSVAFIVDSSNIERTLLQLDTALSPEGLAGFLTGAVGPYVRDRAKERFASEGDDVSGKWAPLKQATEEIRERGPWEVGGAHPINVRTHELEDYITGGDAKAYPHSLGATLRYPNKTTRKKSLVEKMRTAQLGRVSPATVARPVLGMNEQDLAAVMGLLFTYVRSATR